MIIFTCSLNESSTHLLNLETIKELKEDILIINAARGPLVCEKALITHLQSKPKSFAILDVFEAEPFGDQFKNIPNLKTTSHVAGVSQDLDQRIISFAKSQLELMKAGHPFEENLLLHKRIHTYQERRILL